MRWHLIKIARFLARRIRILKFIFVQKNKIHGASPRLYQPLLAAGLGRIHLGTHVRIGVETSPEFWSTYCYIEARSIESQIYIGSDTNINNNLTLISYGSRIEIGEGCLIGDNVFIVDSDFHPLGPELRLTTKPESIPVNIGDNVFIGSGARILKGVSVGKDSVIAAGAVVTRGEYPGRTVIAGNPARVVKHL